MNEIKRCSFCGRSEKNVELLIPSPSGAYICDECVDACSMIIDEYLEESSSDSSQDSPSLSSLSTPAEMKAMLDEYVIGQDKAKITLSVAVYNHYKRILYNEKKGKDQENDVDIQKSNVLLISLRSND